MNFNKTVVRVIGASAVAGLLAWSPIASAADGNIKSTAGKIHKYQNDKKTQKINNTRAFIYHKQAQKAQKVDKIKKGASDTYKYKHGVPIGSGGYRN